jgi:hypothetical protein
LSNFRINTMGLPVEVAVLSARNDPGVLDTRRVKALKVTPIESEESTIYPCRKRKDLRVRNPPVCVPRVQ